MKRRVCIVLLLAGLFGAASGQTIAELQRQIDAAQAEIEATNELLSRTERDRKNNRSQLQLVQNNLTNRRRIITSLDGQIGVVNREVNAKTRTIDRLEKELADLKAEYGALILAAYRSQQSHNVLAFIFAAEDFNDITQRLFYVKRYTMIRERKAVQIDSVSHRLQADVTSLSLKRDSLDRIVESRNREVGNLEREEQEFRRIDTSLGSQARQYNQKIEAQRKRIEDIQNQIARIVAEEARRAVAASRTAAEEEAFVLLTGRFDQNRGRLPYPVSGGVIVERYGSHPHPTQRGVTVNNRGVNIAARRGAPVRAVFEGDIVRVFLTPGAGNTVMIRHGSYFTTYSNLETVSVRVGDRVAINQQIGNLYAGDSAEEYILPFTIWNGTQTQDPEQWLRR